MRLLVCSLPQSRLLACFLFPLFLNPPPFSHTPDCLNPFSINSFRHKFGLAHLFTPSFPHSIKCSRASLNPPILINSIAGLFRPSFRHSRFACLLLSLHSLIPRFLALLCPTSIYSLFTHSFARLLPDALTHSLDYPSTRSHATSLTYSLNQSLIHFLARFLYLHFLNRLILSSFAQWLT